MPDPGCQYDQVIEINLNEVSGEVEFGGLLRMGLLFFGTGQEGGGAGPASTPGRAVGPWFLGLNQAGIGDRQKHMTFSRRESKSD